MKKRKPQKSSEEILWTSFGRETPASRVGKSLVPVGVYSFDLLPFNPAGTPVIDVTTPGGENYLMDIVGTAIQAGDGKLVTCHHVVTDLLENNPESRHYILSRIFRENTMTVISYPIQISIPYIDIRTSAPNPMVDLAVLIAAAKNIPEIPYEIPSVKWGDSSKLGVGDQVIVGGYPYGKDMFLFTDSNRNLIQPTFYSGIISAIIPTTSQTETRLLQISVPVAGGMSGGAVFLPNSGAVIGMVTSCVHAGEVPLSMSYAIPSEVIKPFVEKISFTKK